MARDIAASKRRIAKVAELGRLEHPAVAYGAAIYNNTWSTSVKRVLAAWDLPGSPSDIEVKAKCLPQWVPPFGVVVNSLDGEYLLVNRLTSYAEDGNEGGTIFFVVKDKAGVSYEGTHTVKHASAALLHACKLAGILVDTVDEALMYFGLDIGDFPIGAHAVNYYANDLTKRVV
jgi:hypothetical protein